MESTKEWNEALRLLHKFCPESKRLIKSPGNVTLDNVLDTMKWIDHSMPPRVIYDEELDSITLVKKYFGDYISLEKDRVVVIPDFHARPFICAAQTLFERLSEGIIITPQGEQVKGDLIDGMDALFVFETTGTMLFFDHHFGVSIARPKR